MSQGPGHTWEKAAASHRWRFFHVRVAASTSKQRKSLEGATFTHNHPNGSSLSPNDMLVFINFGFKEIRAVSPTGIVFSLKMRRGAKLPVKTRSKEWGENA